MANSVGLFSHFAVNDMKITPAPFKRELSMESYIIDNPNIMALESFASDVTVLAGELPVPDGGRIKDGRLDIALLYGDKKIDGKQAIAVVELKRASVSKSDVEQLKGYMNQKQAIFDQLKEDNNNTITGSKDDYNWLGILCAPIVADDLRKEIQDGQTEKFSDKGDVLCAISLRRFKDEKTGCFYYLSEEYSNFSSSSNKDYRKIVIDGDKTNPFGKGRAVLQVVKKYVEKNPDISFGDLEEAFPAKLQKTYGVIKKLDEISEKCKKRYYIAEDDIITLENEGFEIAVTNQWGAGNIESFMKNAERLSIAMKWKE